MTSTDCCCLIWKSCRVSSICWIGGQEIARSKRTFEIQLVTAFSVISRMGYRCQSVMMTSGFRCETCPKGQKPMLLSVKMQPCRPRYHLSHTKTPNCQFILYAKEQLGQSQTKLHYKHPNRSIPMYPYPQKASAPKKNPIPRHIQNIQVRCKKLSGKEYNDACRIAKCVWVWGVSKIRHKFT